MSLASKLHSFYQRFKLLPVVGAVLEHRFRRRFARQRIDYNAYCGVYPDFASAYDAAPTTLPIGYDHAETALLYAARTRYVLACDYPALFWLDRLFREGCRSVIDLGGSIGIKYYAFRRYLDYPDDLHWTVCEVPSIAAAGQAWARDHDTQQQITFTHRREDADGHDILFASGCLQYLDYPLRELLDALSVPPRHVLINVVPLHPDKSFFTVQNMGRLYCVYGISAHAEFVAHMKGRGYAIRDQWDQPDRRCDIPYHPQHTVDKYYGFLFSRTDELA